MAPGPNEKDDRIQRDDNSQHTSTESAEKIDRDVEKGESDSSPDRFHEDVRTPTRGGSLAALSQRSSRPQKYTEDGKRIMQEEDCWDALGYQWPSWKKWMLLTSIFTVQVSMNFNTSVFPTAVPLVAEEYGVSEQGARVCQMIFLVLYAFGCELWAPWSEEFGRWKVLQASLFMINIWQILSALAPNFGALVVARGLCGLSTAGGSVTIGMVADLYQADDQQYAIAYVVLSSVLGTSIGPVVAGPITRFLPLQWNFWVQLIFGAAVQAVHFFMPESRSTIIMDQEAKRRRKNGEQIWGPNEVKHPRVSGKEFMITWVRPFEMFFREPIVLSCSLLSGFSDALIFTFQEGFHPVFEKWGFGTLAIAWAFIPINVGYFLAYASYFPWIARDQKVIREKGSDALPPERRLYWLLYLAPLEFFGLFGFAWTSLGPPQVHWFGPMFFSAMIAVANYAIYMSTIDYMVAAYGVYSASATGGNGFARDFLAGIAALYATPLYTNIGAGSGYETEYASTILGCLAFVVLIPVYIIYWKGPQIRAASKFAQGLESQRKEKEGRRLSEAPAEMLERYERGGDP